MPKKAEKTACGADVLRAIRDAYPDGVVNDDIIFGEASYYDAIREEVRAALSRIREADRVYDRPSEGRPHYEDGADPEKDPPSWIEEPASYDLFFLAPRGEDFEFTGELPKDLDDPDSPMVPTVGRIGCSVGISIVAPFAMVTFTEIEFLEDGSTTRPDIFPHIFNFDGSAIDIEAHYEELFLEEGINGLRRLRDEIMQVLDGFDIRVLSTQEFRAKVPGLKPEPTRNVSPKRKAATVAEALFFQTIG